MHKANLLVNCKIKKIKAFFFTFKDNKDKGEHSLLKAFQNEKFHSQMTNRKPYKQLTIAISSYYAHRTRKREKEDTKEKKEEK